MTGFLEGSEACVLMPPLIVRMGFLRDLSSLSSMNSHIWALPG